MRRLHHRLAWTLTALAGGMAAGVLDVRATGVQGPALLVMVGAFAASMIGAPVWAAAVVAASGLPLVHAAAWLGGAGGGPPSAGMAVAVVPALVAAGAGRIARGLATRAGAALARGSTPGVTRAVVAALAGCAAVGAIPVLATLVAREQPFAWWVTLWWQLVGFVAWGAAAPSVFARARGRAEAADADVPTGRIARIAGDAAIVAAVAALHAIVLVGLTAALFVPAGPHGGLVAIAWAFAAYLPTDALTYVLLQALATAHDADRLARESARRAAALTAALTAHQMAALRAQLRPHFLFNALNAATVLARRGDAAGTARVLGDLAELLRYVLAAGEGGDVVRLDDELSFTARYLEVERVRFPARLRPSIEADAEARAALVPPLVLQPLVENAVRHGIAGRLGAGEVRVRAWREREALHVTVEDDGPGPATRPDGDARTGVGLANTRARLAVLHGERASLTLAAREGENAGAVAHLVLPFQCATRPAASAVPAA